MSRLSGEIFEYTIARFLKETYNLSFYDIYSSKKYNKWQRKFPYKEPNMQFIDEFTSYDKIRLCPDTDGCKGSSSDLELHNKFEFVPISLKNNNLSIKHLRCSSIYNHIVPNLQKEYMNKYSTLNDMYFQLAQENNYALFKDFSESEKNSLYSDLKGVLFNVCKKSAESCKRIFEFCIGIHHTRQIIIKQTKGIIELYKYKPLNLQQIKIKNLSDSSFLLTISGISLRFRIHSASSRITKKLSMKYDVKPEDMDSLFEKIENE